MARFITKIVVLSGVVLLQAVPVQALMIGGRAIYDNQFMVSISASDEDLHMSCDSFVKQHKVHGLTVEKCFADSKQVQEELTKENEKMNRFRVGGRAPVMAY